MVGKEKFGSKDHTAALRIFSDIFLVQEIMPEIKQVPVDAPVLDDEDQADDEDTPKEGSPQEQTITTDTRIITQVSQEERMETEKGSDSSSDEEEGEASDKEEGEAEDDKDEDKENKAEEEKGDGEVKDDEEKEKKGKNQLRLAIWMCQSK